MNYFVCFAFLNIQISYRYEWSNCAFFNVYFYNDCYLYYPFTIANIKEVLNRVIVIFKLDCKNVLKKRIYSESILSECTIERFYYNLNMHEIDR